MDFDHPQIFTGPPRPSMKKSLHGYPNVVYLVVAGGGTCGNLQFGGYGLNEVVGKDGTIYKTEIKTTPLAKQANRPSNPKPSLLGTLAGWGTLKIFRHSGYWFTGILMIFF